jgi:hypothetical protein
LHDLDKAKRGIPTEVPPEQLRNQAQECVKVVSLWRESSLMLDEVDLILHPLKSELNYPVGMKVSYKSNSRKEHALIFITGSS